MKKAISLLLVLVMVLSLCACGGKSGETSANDKYAGTYETNTWYIVASMSEPYMGSTLYKDYPVDGKMTMILNSDGTGTTLFTATENVTLTNQAVFDEMSHGTLTWSVDGDYINITFNRVTYVDANDPFKMTDVRRETSTTETFELKGMQLINVSSGSSYTKIS